MHPLLGQPRRGVLEREIKRSPVLTLCFLLISLVALSHPCQLSDWLVCSGCQTCWSQSQGEFFFFHNVFSVGWLCRGAASIPSHMKRMSSHEGSQLSGRTGRKYFSCFILAPKTCELPLWLIQPSCSLLVRKKMCMLLIFECLSSLEFEHGIKSLA